MWAADPTRFALRQHKFDGIGDAGDDVDRDGRDAGMLGRQGENPHRKGDRPDAEADQGDEQEEEEATRLALADQKAAGWMRGRMEFDPRALGGRPILDDARSPSMQRMPNLKMKYRESLPPPPITT